jgi:hypothetical protein
LVNKDGETKEYIVLNVDENKITINETLTDKKVLVFGKEVDDFHTISKEYIFTLNVSATQELYKLIQQQNQIIQDLQNRILILESK